MRLVIALLPLIPALAAAPAALAGAQDQPDHMLAAGPHFEVVCWFWSERAGERPAEEVVRTAELVWDQGRELYGLPDSALENGPFQVYVYDKRRGPKGYANAVDGLEPGRSTGTHGFGDWASRGVHVKQLPTVSDRVLERVGLPAPTLRKAAHEAARMLRIEAAAGLDVAPSWFADGSAGWLAGRAMVEIGRAAPGVSSAWLSSRVRQVRGRAPSLGEYLTGDGSQVDPALAPALSEVVFTFLMEHSGTDAAWRALGAEITDGLSGDALAARLDEALGEEWATTLDEGFRAWLAAAQTPWEEQLPSFSTHLAGDGWVQMPARGDNAICWSTAPPPAAAYVMSGEFLLFRDRDGMGQLNLVLGRLFSGDFISISFNSINGVQAWDYSAATGEYNSVTGKGFDEPLPIRDWVPFRIEVRDERVFISVGTLEMRPFDVTGRDMGGSYGYGTFTGSVALWRDLEVTAYTEAPRDGDDD